MRLIAPGVHGVCLGHHRHAPAPVAQAHAQVGVLEVHEEAGVEQGLARFQNAAVHHQRSARERTLAHGVVVGLPVAQRLCSAGLAYPVAGQRLPARAFRGPGAQRRREPTGRQEPLQGRVQELPGCDRAQGAVMFQRLHQGRRASRDQQHIGVHQEEAACSRGLHRDIATPAKADVAFGAVDMHRGRQQRLQQRPFTVVVAVVHDAHLDAGRIRQHRPHRRRDVGGTPVVDQHGAAAQAHGASFSGVARTRKP